MPRHATIVPVSYKVSHELREEENDPKLADLVDRLSDVVDFDGRKILYNWLGATRHDWRGQGNFRALTEAQEVWAVEQGYDEMIVKTKNRYYDMRGALDSLQFNVNGRGYWQDVPRDAFWKTGSGGYCLYVIPSLELVVFKMGGRDSQYSPENTGLPPAPGFVYDGSREAWRAQDEPGVDPYHKTLRLVLAALEGV